jgi:hypothetical protein
MAAVWAFLGAVVGTVGRADVGGGLCVVTFAMAGVVVLSPIGAVLGLIGGGVRGTLIGVAAGAVVGLAHVGVDAASGLVAGALFGASLRPYLRAVGGAVVVLSRSFATHLLQPVTPGQPRPGIPSRGATTRPKAAWSSQVRGTAVSF